MVFWTAGTKKGTILSCSRGLQNFGTPSAQAPIKEHYEFTIFSPLPLSSFSFLTPYPLFSPLCSLGVQQRELSVDTAFLARSVRPWSRIKGNWGRTAAAPALLLFPN
jgi:hypothetical protein